ncbi:MAG: XRE family transcriptional regulator [Clostridia bacterium]|nr:XRE family transcriptional regulator [Clostridia bacterium]
MASDFSRTLALLRREKKISQRTAAGDLMVSQALLSHYENGLREPGLSFVVRAADYYGVSSDYLLGRSMARDGSAVSAENLPDASEDKGNVLHGSVAAMLHKKLIVNSAALLFELGGKSNNRQLTNEISTYLSLAIYKVFRYLYAADESSPAAVFRTGETQFDYLCDAQMRLAELRIRLATQGEEGYGIKAEDTAMPSLDLAELSREYPGMSQSLLTLLQTVSDNLTALDGVQKAEKKKGK